MDQLKRKLVAERATHTDSARGLLQRYERAAHAGGKGLWEWDLGSGQMWCSPALERLLGYPGDSPHRKHLSNVNDFFAHVEQHDRDRVLQLIRRHLEQHHPLELDCRLKLQNGELRRFALRGLAERDIAGRPQRLSGSLHDITAGQRSDGSGEATELQGRALDALHFAVALLNESGEIMTVNRHWYDFCGDQALIGKAYAVGENYPQLCAQAQSRCPEAEDAANGIRAVLEGRQQTYSLNYRIHIQDEARDYQLRVRSLVESGTGHQTSCAGALVTHMDVPER